MIYFYALAILSVLAGLFYYLYLLVTPKKNKIKKEDNIKKEPKIAILIPARNESAVIEELLDSLLKQSVFIDPKDIYVITESIDDPTIKIVKEKKMSFFVRKKLNLKTKGYALAECLEDLEAKQKYYDLYFIFDADNILDKDFIKYMLEDYYDGYAISTGYRTLKNSDSYFPVTAGLTFFMINEIRNRSAIKKQGSLILSGTGYYINGKYIKKWKTFPFHSLTEDYESSLYYALEGISTHYQDKAIFYDEQPKSYKESIVQRSRWIKGYLANWLEYRPKLKKKLKEKKALNPRSLQEMYIGITPALYMVFGLILLVILVVLSTSFSSSWQLLLYCLCFLGIIYLCLLLLTAILLWMVGKQIKISFKVYFGTLFYHPIFIISYVHAFLVAIFKKNLGWQAIKHEKVK